MTTVKTKRTTHGKEKSGVQVQDVTSKSWGITNNTDIDIVVINAFSANDDDTTELYAQTLQTLADSNGKKVISKKASGTFSLDADQLVNNLIIARADTLSPLKVIDEPDTGATMPIAVSVTSADVDAAGQAEKFQQYIVAFPSSDLATGYAAALDDNDPAAIQHFFPAQKGYEQVTLSMAVAFQTYYDRFPFVYAAYQKVHSYYLYASDGTANTYMGSVELSNSNTAPLDTADALGKFRATFTNSTETTDTRLSWSNGQFANNADNPSICLRGLFVQRSMLTKVETDSGLMATLGGTVDGKEILAYDQQIHKNKQGIYADLDALVHPDSTLGYVKLVGACLATLAGLIVLVVVAKKIADRIRKSRLTPEEIRAQKLELIRKNRAEVERIVKKMNPNAQLPEDVRVSLAAQKERVTDWLIEQQRLGLLDTIEKQQIYHDEILDHANNPRELQKVTDNIERVYENLPLAPNRRALEPKLKELIDLVKANTKILDNTMSGIKYKFDVETKKTITEAKARIDLVTKHMDANEADRERIADDEVPDVDIVEVVE